MAAAQFCGVAGPAGAQMRRRAGRYAARRGAGGVVHFTRLQKDCHARIRDSDQADETVPLHAGRGAYNEHLNLRA